jgi:phosphoribosylaminoimidazole-succinocarboxamide synthase
VRRWLVSKDFSGDGPIPLIPDEVRVEATRRYVHAVETITGSPFEANLEEPLPRIGRALSKT